MSEQKMDGRIEEWIEEYVSDYVDEHCLTSGTDALRDFARFVLGLAAEVCEAEGRKASRLVRCNHSYGIEDGAESCRDRIKALGGE